jgi:hypothetical protein
MNAGPMHEMGHYVKFVENSLTAYMVRSAYKVEMSKEKHFCGTVYYFAKRTNKTFRSHRNRGKIYFLVAVAGQTHASCKMDMAKCAVNWPSWFEHRGCALI